MAGRSAQGAGNLRKKTVVKGDKTYTFWEGRLTVGRDPGTGKQVRKSFSGKTQKEVREAMQAAAVSVNSGTFVEPSKMTLSKWLDQWLDGLYKQKYSTVKHYRSMVENHIKPRMGALQLCQLRKSDFDAFYKYLLTSGKEVSSKDDDGKITVSREPLSQKSVKNIHVILKGTISAAVDADILSVDPMRKVSIPTPPKPEIKPLTDAQVKAYTAAIADDEMCNILSLILFTGLREAEAMGLTWDCIDFDAGTLKVKQQLQDRKSDNGGMVIVPTTKNDKIRILKPAPFVMAILKRQKTQQLEERMRVGELWQGWQNEEERKTGLVFSNALGLPYRPKTVYQHHKKAAEKIGAPECTVHDLRHTYAVLSLQNGDSPKTVQGNLGHATAAFTLDVYGHVSETMKAESSARMEAYIQNIGI